jgi:hypothetical protein
MASQTVHDYVEGDTLPELLFQFSALSLYSFIRLEVTLEDGLRLPAKIVDVADPPSGVSGFVDDDVLGIIRFAWLSGELVPGHHTARLVLVRASDSKEETLPKGLPILIRVAGETGG